VENSYFHRLVERLFRMSRQASSIDRKDSNSSAVREKYGLGNESQGDFPWNSAIFLATLIICGALGYKLFGSHLAAFSQAVMRTTRKHFKTETDLAECQHVHGDRDHRDFCGVEPHNVDFVVDQHPNVPSDALRRRRRQTASLVQEAASMEDESEHHSALFKAFSEKTPTDDVDKW
jgi:hypothetical protein